MKENICIDLKNVGGFISQEEILALAKKSTLHLDTLNKGTGQGSDFLGWLSLPEDIVPQLDDIEKTAQQLRALSDTTVVIGIGGSYLGSKAIIEALGNSVPGNNNDHTIMFAGHNICEDYLAELLEVVDKKITR